MKKIFLASLVGTMAISCLENEDFYTPTEINSIENQTIYQRSSYQNEINDSISIKDLIKENDDDDDTPPIRNNNTKRENTNNHHFKINDFENIQ